VRFGAQAAVRVQLVLLAAVPRRLLALIELKIVPSVAAARHAPIR
jgi:hypothetical protein